MNLFALNAMFWVLGIRGHIPGRDDFPSGPDRRGITADTIRLIRILAIFVAFAVFLSLALWATAWLATKLL
jgi:hypothetical protein